MYDIDLVYIEKDVGCRSKLILLVVLPITHTSVGLDSKKEVVDRPSNDRF